MRNNIERPDNDTPEFRIERSDGKEIIVTPENSHVIQHAFGKVAIRGMEYDSSQFDHIVVRNDMDTMSAILFRGKEESEIFNTQAYEEAMNYMVENNYPMMLHKSEVADYAVQLYFANISSHAESEAENIDAELYQLLDEESDRDEDINKDDDRDNKENLEEGRDE